MRTFLAMLLGCCLASIGSTSFAAEKPLINIVYDIADIATAFRLIDNKDQSQPYSEQELLQLLRRTATHTNFRESLSPLDTLDIRVHEKTTSLVVRASQTQHDQLAAFLEKIRTEELVQISYEIRHITLSKEGLKKAELAYDKILTKDDSIPVGIVEITDLEAFHFVQDVQADPHSNIMFAPKLTAFNGQTVEVNDVARRPFVTGVNLEAGDQVQTELTVINEGLKIELHGFATDENSIKIHAEATWTQLQGVDLVKFAMKGSDGASKPVAIQVPEVEKALVKIDSTLNDDKSILIVFLKPQTFPAPQATGIVQTAFEAAGLSTWVEKSPDEEVYSAVMITPRFIKQ